MLVLQDLTPEEQILQDELNLYNFNVHLLSYMSATRIRTNMPLTDEFI